MRVQNAPRYQGKIASWKDEQGFGFIAPNGGGPNVFVHIKSFSRQGARPQVDDIVTYHLGANDKGQARADNVAFVRAPASPQIPASSSGQASYIAATIFLVGLSVATWIGKAPASLLAAYLTVSVIAFIVYAADKSAARKRQRRTPESRLHMLALFGGWPGALVAQQVFRHKTSKESFRNGFWLTVFLNCCALAWLMSSYGADVRMSIEGLRLPTL